MTRPTPRPRRALLFCPGTERSKIEKAAKIDADGIILDLEDAAALSMKAEARAITTAALAEIDFGRKERCVRINPHGSGLEDADLGALASGARAPDSVMLPKTESAESLHWLDQRLGDIEREKALKTGTIRVLALIETARGVVELRDIARASSRVDALVFGAEDLCGDIGATRTPEGREVAVARSMLVVQAAAERLQAIDTPYVHLNDTEGLIRDTRDGLIFGYTGRLAIHPKQVHPILEVFTPTREEIDTANRLVAEHTKHQAEGRGVFELDGKMVDMPMIRAALRVLQRARNAGLS